LRRGRISREQGLRMIMEHDGKYPSSYLGKPLIEILKPLGLNIEEFDQICDRFTNKSLFKLNSAGDLLRDSSKNLVKINYDN
jgi:hypothetical protein